MTLLRLVPACFLLLSACDNNQVAAPPPPPVELSSDAIGHYCSMVVAEHPGPKAQIFVSDVAVPRWFPSVRDMFAYTMLPEENQDIRAIYVSDTGASDNYATVADGAWVEAMNAHYVLGSKIAGGMGLPETIPFADAIDAAAFAQEYGGKVVSFDEVTLDYIFAEIDADSADNGGKL